MVVGVKYCGGCNPRYERGDAFLRLKKKFPQTEWVGSDSEAICDYWLIICGCNRACMDISAFKAKKEIIVLNSQMDFKKAADKLAAFTEEKTACKVLTVGMTATLSKKMEPSEGMRFAEYPWFQKPVVPGMMLSCLLSDVMTAQLPGDGAMLLEENSKFLKPVFEEDIMTAKITLEGIQEEKDGYIGTFLGECINQNGEVVVTMQARQMMMKDLFQIEECKNDKLREV